MDPQIILLSSNELVKKATGPYTSDMIVSLFVSSGHTSFFSNLRHIEVGSNEVLIILPGQIFEQVAFSDDFEAKAILLSKEFTNSLDIPVSLSEKLFISSNSVFSIAPESMNSFNVLWEMLNALMKVEDNPYLKEAEQSLIRSWFFGMGFYMHGRKQSGTILSAPQILCDKFISMLGKEFRIHRNVHYYADKLCVTPRHLSNVLSKETGMTGMQWVESFVIKYAKARLSSTSLTIQQISDELSFSDQSEFGKYFKRLEGLSPSAYRKQLAAKDSE